MQSNACLFFFLQFTIQICPVLASQAKEKYEDARRGGEERKNRVAVGSFSKHIPHGELRILSIGSLSCPRRRMRTAPRRETRDAHEHAPEILAQPRDSRFPYAPSRRNGEFTSPSWKSLGDRSAIVGCISQAGVNSPRGLQNFQARRLSTGETTRRVRSIVDRAR